MTKQSVRKTLDDVQASMAVNGGSKGLQTMVDLVLAIDGTVSMVNLMDAVKENAMTLHSRIRDALADKKRIASKIRVKVIVFRDVYYGDPVPFQESDFFILQADGQGDEEAFRDYVASIEATGGGDIPENGLEALHMAMDVDFHVAQQGQKSRQIIVMLTDAPAHSLQDPRRAELMADQMKASAYPVGVPADLQGLRVEWEEKMNVDGRRMLVFAPNASPWNEISTWPDVYHVPSTAGVGIDRAKFDEVIAAIAGSVS